MSTRGITVALVMTLLAATIPGRVLAGPYPGRPATDGARQESIATYVDASCPFPLPEDQIEGEELHCGILTVPAFHAEPEGETFELFVLTYHSTGNQPAEEPLVLLVGGPGQEIASILPAFSESSPVNYLPLLERQDVIVLEQRGIGYSRPSLACPFDEVGGQKPEVDASEIEDAVGAFEVCVAGYEEQGIDLEAFDTRESAADVNDLRTALGYEQVDLLGTSYGSKLALTVMRDYPEAVRSAILNSPLPLQANVAAGQIIHFDQALRRLFAACAADPLCGADHPDLDQAFSVAVERLNAEPVPLTVTNPVNGELVDLVIDGNQFIMILYIATFVGLLLPFVPNMIDAAAAGSIDPLEFVAPFSVAFTAGISYGANFVYHCNDELSFTDADEVAELIEEADVLPELSTGSFAGTFESFAICDVLDVDPAHRRENRPARSEVPALIMVGEYDPITPPEYGEMAAATLPNSELVVVPGLGHDPITAGGPCVLEIASAYLANPGEAVDRSCLSELELVFFV